MQSADIAFTGGPYRRPWVRFALIGFALALGAVLALCAFVWSRTGVLSPYGGIPFFRETVLDVPLFLQADPRWADDLLGPTEGTLGAEGCAVASAAMVLASYGVDTDPGKLNAFLKTVSGFTESGWIYWEKAAELAPDRVRFDYESDASHRLIDWNLIRGNPVIVRLRFPSGITHFVVICGKRGFDYLIRDPGSKGAEGIYPLREFGSRIEALRYYSRIGRP